VEDQEMLLYSFAVKTAPVNSQSRSERPLSLPSSLMINTYGKNALIWIIFLYLN